MHRYEHCGLRIASELAIPELDPVDDHGAVDVQVALGDAGPAGGDAPTFAVSDRECRIWMPAAGHYEVRGGREIVVRPRPDAEAVSVTLVLLASAWAALLHQRGSFALHASVTADRDEAVAYCGAQGAGKSTLAASLVRDGHGLVSDDLTRLDVPDDGPPLVWPSVPRLKLTPEATAAGGWSGEPPQPPMPDGKQHLRWTDARPSGPLPLRAIYVLAWGEARVCRFSGREAVEALLAAATYRPQLLERRLALDRHWRQCISLAQRVPVIELRRPRDWTSIRQADLAVEQECSQAPETSNERNRKWL